MADEVARTCQSQEAWDEGTPVDLLCVGMPKNEVACVPGSSRDLTLLASYGPRH